MEFFFLIFSLQEMAIQIEQGLSSNPITLEWVSKPNKSATSDAPNMTGFQSGINSTLFPVDDPSASKSDSKFPSYSSAPKIFVSIRYLYTINSSSIPNRFHPEKKSIGYGV